MCPIFKYTGDQTVVYTALKNRNGTTVKAEPGKLFDFQSAPTTKDANGLDVPITEFVQLSDDQAERERAGEDTTTAADAPPAYVAPSGDAPPPVQTPANANVPAGTTPESLLKEAEVAAEALLAKAAEKAEALAEADVEPFLKEAESKAEQIITDVKTKIEELFGKAPTS